MGAGEGLALSASVAATVTPVGLLRASAGLDESPCVQDRLFGTRLLRGTIALGGVKRDLTTGDAGAPRAHAVRFEQELDELIQTLIDAGTFTDRVDTTGILAAPAARDLGIVGMAARASGIDADCRRDHPFAAYEGLEFEVPVEEGGDVRARLMVRAREVNQSLRILHQVLEAMPDAPRCRRSCRRSPRRSGGWKRGGDRACTGWPPAPAAS